MCRKDAHSRRVREQDEDLHQGQLQGTVYAIAVDMVAIDIWPFSVLNYGYITVDFGKILAIDK